MHQLQYRRASTDDVDRLVLLLNQAYRSNTGSSWTSEYGMVAGDRINQQQLLQSLELPNFAITVAEMVEHLELKIVACIGLTFQYNSVEIGTFCVALDWQNQGIGKQLLKYAETQALEMLPTLTHYDMFVLDARTELIQYYERCGYFKTEHIESYPIHANVGQPLIDLQLQQMSKPVSKQ